MTKTTAPVVISGKAMKDVMQGKEGARERAAAEWGEAVETFLKSVNGKASAWATTSHPAVLYLCFDAEAKMDQRGITQENRASAVLTHTGCGPSANSYRYAVNGTRVTVRRNTKGTWTLVGAEQVAIYPKAPERFTVRISQAAQANVLRKAMEGFTVEAPAATLVEAA